MTTLLVLFGGISSEHQVSLKSAATVMTMLGNEDYNIIPVGITMDGRWMYTRATPAEIADGSWETHPENCRAILSPERKNHGVLLVRDGKDETVEVDCVWPVLHGKNGEDGTVQGLCELAGLPYVGPGVFASSASMDKSQTKIVVAPTGVKQADYCLLTRYAWNKDAQGEMNAVLAHFDHTFPLFVKPCAAGSSIGVSKVARAEDLKAAVEAALECDDRVLVEETIVGREVEVAVLGNDDPKASVVGEVLSANEFYDYSAKYINAASRTVIPAQVSDAALERLQRSAIEIYRALDCKGLSRVDFFLTEGDVPVFNEINTLPGFTNISMYPKLWEATGVSNSQLVNELVKLAVECER